MAFTQHKFPNLAPQDSVTKEGYVLGRELVARLVSCGGFLVATFGLE